MQSIDDVFRSPFNGTWLKLWFIRFSCFITRLDFFEHGFVQYHPSFFCTRTLLPAECLSTLCYRYAFFLTEIHSCSVILTPSFYFCILFSDMPIQTTLSNLIHEWIQKTNVKETGEGTEDDTKMNKTTMRHLPGTIQDARGADIAAEVQNDLAIDLREDTRVVAGIIQEVAA